MTKVSSREPWLAIPSMTMWVNVTVTSEGKVSARYSRSRGKKLTVPGILTIQLLDVGYDRRDVLLGQPEHGNL